jgi:hypothetical protein
LFWDEAGNPLEAVFIKTNKRSGFVVSSGTYSLRVVHGGSPMEGVLAAAYLEPNQWFASVEALRQYLIGRRKDIGG